MESAIVSPLPLIPSRKGRGGMESAIVSLLPLILSRRGRGKSTSYGFIRGRVMFTPCKTGRQGRRSVARPVEGRYNQLAGRGSDKIGFFSPEQERAGGVETDAGDAVRDREIPAAKGDPGC